MSFTIYYKYNTFLNFYLLRNYFYLIQVFSKKYGARTFRRRQSTIDIIDACDTLEGQLQNDQRIECAIHRIVRKFLSTYFYLFFCMLYESKSIFIVSTLLLYYPFITKCNINVDYFSLYLKSIC